MIRKPFLIKIYDAASMQRWNDQIRVVEFTELDKQAHKMIVAYVLGKYEQECGTEGFDWLKIIEGGIFEYLQRIILTDLKPPLFHKIKENRQKYIQLNQWVYDNIVSIISPLGEDFCSRFKNYLIDTERDINRRIISAAHFYATRWEFDIIERVNPSGYAIGEIKKDILDKQKKYHDLKSMRRFLSSPGLKNFVDICGQLRFQLRWSHLHRVPKTSVLGHMLIVAMLGYLFTSETSQEPKHCINNYFTGLFHDLPEVLTRDIINPVKRSIEGLKELIQEYEIQEMQRKIYKLIPESWHSDIRMFTENEFTDIKEDEKKVIRDGRILKASDDLAAFLELYLSMKNGIQNDALKNAKFSLLEKYKSEVISGVDFGQIYADFD